MALDNIALSDLSTVQALGTSLLYVAIVDPQTAGKYLSGKITAEDLANLINNSIQYTSQLNTTSKTIIGAINELEAGGGGGGSSVSWSQLIATGTKIATITINGVATDVYAPTSGGASYTDVTGTLAAGATTVTLQDQSILTTSTIDIYTDTFGVNPTNVVVTTGQIVLTFEAQQSAVGVKVRVS